MQLKVWLSLSGQPGRNEYVVEVPDERWESASDIQRAVLIDEKIDELLYQFVEIDVAVDNGIPHLVRQGPKKRLPKGATQSSRCHFDPNIGGVR